MPLLCGGAAGGVDALEGTIFVVGGGEFGDDGVAFSVGFGGCGGLIRGRVLVAVIEERAEVHGVSAANEGGSGEKGGLEKLHDDDDDSNR